MQNKILDKFLQFILILSSLGAFQRVVVNKQIRFFLFEPLFYIFLISCAIYYRRKLLDLLKKKFRPLAVFLLFLYLHFFLSFPFFDFKVNLVGFLYLLRLSFFLLSFPILFMFFQRKNIKVFKKTSQIFLILIIIFSLTQFFLYPNLRNLQYQGWDPHLWRMFGVFLDTYLQAAITGILGLVALYLNWQVIGYTLLLFLLASFSRAGILSLILSLFLFSKLDHRKKSLLLTIFTFATAVFFYLNPFTGGDILRTATLQTRLEDTKQAILLSKKTFFLGVGYNRISAFKKEKYAKEIAEIKPLYNAKSFFHNVYLSILASVGIIGLVLFILMLARLVKIYPFAKIWSFVLIFSLFDNVFLHTFVLFYLSFFLNLVKKITEK